MIVPPSKKPADQHTNSAPRGLELPSREPPASCRFPPRRVVPRQLWLSLHTKRGLTSIASLLLARPQQLQSGGGGGGGKGDFAGVVV